MNKINRVQFLFALAALPLNAQWVHKTGSCNVVSDEKTPMVVILKQWHLPPNVNTKTRTPQTAPLPQAKNQKEIYEQLSAWLKAKEVDTVIAEGCEGEITPQFKEVFQGWSYADLDAHKTDSNFPDLLSHAVVKLKVIAPNAVHALCGDNLAEIKKSQVALSDARADVGYLSRVSENKANPEALKPYLDGVIEEYHLKADASASEALNALTIDLKKSLDTFQNSTHERDLSFIQKATLTDSKKPVVVVIGGLHAQDLKQTLESKKINCLILEPVSYQNDEEALNQKLKSLVH